MPTYDYKCKKCDHTWEAFQSIKAEPIKKCPECGKNQAQRLISGGGGILFKGGGFYETDYRSDSYKKAAKADSEAARPKSDSSSKSESKSDTSTKSESKPAKAASSD